jgi:hypothetical protein
MDSNQSSNNCGKVCLFSCLGCLGLVVILFLILWIAACAGCAGGLGMLSGLFSSIGDITKISGHFEDLKDEGWEVDDSGANQPSGYGAEVEAGVPMTWLAREDPDDEWIEYTWVMVMPGLEEMEEMDEEDEPSFSEVMGMLEFILIPVTEEALEVHRELGLELPDDFDIDDWSDYVQGTGDDRGRDRDRDDRARDEDEDDGENGDENGDDDDGDREHERRSKSLRKAA